MHLCVWGSGLCYWSLSLYSAFFTGLFESTCVNFPWIAEKAYDNLFFLHLLCNICSVKLSLLHKHLFNAPLCTSSHCALQHCPCNTMIAFCLHFTFGHLSPVGTAFHSDACWLGGLQFAHLWAKQSMFFVHPCLNNLRVPYSYTVGSSVWLPVFSLNLLSP